MSRGPSERIEWFLTYRPGGAGWCLRHTWQATAIPAQGIPDANAGWRYVAGHGHMRQGHAPLGAWVWWSSETHGHVALSLGDGRIASTDAYGPATTGIVPIGFPTYQWGHRMIGWSDWFGVGFDVGREVEDVPLTDHEIEKIAELAARKVWNFAIAESGENKAPERPAKVYLREAWKRAGRAADK